MRMSDAQCPVKIAKRLKLSSISADITDKIGRFSLRIAADSSLQRDSIKKQKLCVRFGSKCR